VFAARRLPRKSRNDARVATTLPFHASTHRANTQRLTRSREVNGNNRRYVKYIGARNIAQITTHIFYKCVNSFFVKARFHRANINKTSFIDKVRYLHICPMKTSLQRKAVAYFPC
jgi:hypothetical protein